jgi:metallophosphoesterase (TIGR00282 family)
VKVLLVGDIYGEPGRRVLARHLPKLIVQHSIDLVIGNAENIAGGFGVTAELVHELFEMGFSALTTGNHAWDKKESIDLFRYEPRLLRPANYPPGVPGQGSTILEAPNGQRIGLLQLMGRVFMPTLDCPFQVAQREVAKLKEQVVAIVVDMHAEASSEKMAMGHFLDGQVAAVVGTHTHVQTADEQIFPKGTAYMTDLGMTGPLYSVIGVKKELVIQKFLTQMPCRFEVAPGPAVLCAAVVELDPQLGKAIGIQRIRLME